MSKANTSPADLRNPSSLISDDLVIPRTVLKHIPPRGWNLIHRSPRTRQQDSCLPLLRCSLLPTKSAVLCPQRCRVQLVRRGYLRCFHASPCCCSARDSCELKSRWKNTTPDWARSSCRALINMSSPLVSTRRDSSVGRTRKEIGSWSKYSFGNDERYISAVRRTSSARNDHFLFA